MYLTHFPNTSVQSGHHIGHLAIVLRLLWLLKMVVLHMAYCTCTMLLFLFAPLLYDNIICGFFFYLGSQSVSCKASLAALRLYGYFLWFLSCVCIEK